MNIAGKTRRDFLKDLGLSAASLTIPGLVGDARLLASESSRTDRPLPAQRSLQGEKAVCANKKSLATKER